MDPSLDREKMQERNSDALVADKISKVKEEIAFETDDKTADGGENMATSNEEPVTKSEPDRPDIQKDEVETLHHNGTKDSSSVEHLVSHDAAKSEMEDVALGPANGAQDMESSDRGAGDDDGEQVEPASLENNVDAEERIEESDEIKPASTREEVTRPNTEEKKQEKENVILDPSPSERAVAEAFKEETKEEGPPASADGVVTKAEVKEKEEEWQDILGNGLLKKQVLKQGRGRDTRPEKGQIVTLRTAGRMEDGTAVDWNHGMEFIQGDMEVIPALDLTVALMEVGEVCKVVTDSKYAYGQYGKQDNNPPIPPNANITYELELLAVRDGPNIHNMKDEERINLANKKRELGNDLFTRKDYSGAINCYQQALKYLGTSENPEVQDAKIKCWNNLAAAQLKIKAYQAAHNSCMEVLQVDENNVKALFRRGKVLAAQGELAEALEYMKRASQLEPANKTIRSELLQMRRLRAAQHQEEKNLYQRMVGGLGQEEKEKNSGSSLFSWPFLLGATAVAVGGILTALYMTRH